MKICLKEARDGPIFKKYKSFWSRLPSTQRTAPYSLTEGGEESYLLAQIAKWISPSRSSLVEGDEQADHPKSQTWNVVVHVLHQIFGML